MWKRIPPSTFPWLTWVYLYSADGHRGSECVGSIGENTHTQVTFCMFSNSMSMKCDAASRWMFHIFNNIRYTLFICHDNNYNKSSRFCLPIIKLGIFGITANVVCVFIAVQNRRVLLFFLSSFLSTLRSACFPLHSATLHCHHYWQRISFHRISSVHQPALPMNRRTMFEHIVCAFGYFTLFGSKR